MNIRCLTESGIREFRAHLAQLRENGRLPPPKKLLTDRKHSRPLESGVATVEPRGFPTRRDFAEYIDGRFRASGLSGDVDEPGLWEWLSLLYFDAVCPPDGSGIRNPGADARHLVNLQIKKGGRHLLRGPYRLHRDFEGGTEGELDLLLSYPLPNYGAAVTALSERQGRIMSSQGALIAASRLYFDKATNGRKRGYTNPVNGVRAFSKLVTNLPNDFDLARLSADAIIALLPPEFEKWTGPALDSNTEPLVHELDVLLQHFEDRSLTKSQAKVRSRAFRVSVIDAYQSKCAISGLGLTHLGSTGTKQHEVEAAHIIPVEHNGTDRVQNGLALTRTLHWAFDRGMLWINDGFRVSLSAEAERDNRNEWLRQFKDRPLALPAQRRHYPHAEALRWHAKQIAGI